HRHPGGCGAQPRASFAGAPLLRTGGGAAGRGGTAAGGAGRGLSTDPVVQSRFVPKSSGSLTAVVVSGGKQYRVASGDRILVDRLAAEPGARLALGRVLMVAEGDDLKIGAEALAGPVVAVRVLEPLRGPKVGVLRH